MVLLRLAVDLGQLLFKYFVSIFDVYCCSWQLLLGYDVGNCSWQLLLVTAPGTDNTNKDLLRCVLSCSPLPVLRSRVHRHRLSQCSFSSVVFGSVCASVSYLLLLLLLLLLLFLFVPVFLLVRTRWVGKPTSIASAPTVPRQCPDSALTVP